MAVAFCFLRSGGLGAFGSRQAIQMIMLAGQGRYSSTYAPCLTFAPGQEICGEQRVGPLVAEHQAEGRLFYGIEILVRTRRGPVNLDFNKFLPVLPIFVSVVWHSLRFWNVNPIGDTECLVLCKKLAARIPTMPHLTCYRLSKQRMDEFLALDFKNLLALRGDDVEPNQEFEYAVDLTQYAKCRKGDKMSVSVAGFPDGYNPNERGPEAMAKNMEIMKAKIAAGADCIITQMCYKSDVIIKYVKNCRAEGIKVPILIGIMSHETYDGYKRMQKKGEAELPPELEKEVLQIQCQNEGNPEKQQELISQFFIKENVRIIKEVLAASDEVLGIVFFTLNRFDSVHLMIKELHDLGLFKAKKKN